MRALIKSFDSVLKPHSLTHFVSEYLSACYYYLYTILIYCYHTYILYCNLVVDTLVLPTTVLKGHIRL
jgi:hypothetical protein